MIKRQITKKVNGLVIKQGLSEINYLDKDYSMRRNCFLAMFNSLLINKELIEECLALLRLFKIMLSDDEWLQLRMNE